MEDKFTELLLKYRKGATAGFSTTTWFKVLTLVGGWGVVVNERGTNFTITAPNGETFNLVKQEGYRVVTFYDFAPWAKKQGLMDQVLAKLGMPSLDEERKANKYKNRDLSNTGTCGICGQNVKRASDGGLVLHGYERPGWGYVQGRCYGVGYQPFELSTNGVRNYIFLLEEAKTRTEDRIVHHETIGNDLYSVSGTGPTRWDPNRKTEWVKKDEAGYEKERQRVLDETKTEAAGIARELQHFGELVKNWKLMPLPDAK